MIRTGLFAFRFLLAASLAAALTACAANPAAGVPGGAAAQPAAAPQSIQNDAGEYGGPVQDSKYGKGFLSGSLMQHEHAVGGYLTATYGSKTIQNAVAVQTQTGASVGGGEESNVDSSVCTFKMTATYSEKTNVLKGTYNAVHGCSGESGSFSITKGCYFPRTGLDAVRAADGSDVRPDHGLHQC